MSIEVGWFGKPHRRASGTHVIRNGKPVCQYRPAQGMAFQFCCAGIRLDYIECPRCKDWVVKQRLTRI